MPDHVLYVSYVWLPTHIKLLQGAFDLNRLRNLKWLPCLAKHCMYVNSTQMCHFNEGPTLNLNISSMCIHPRIKILILGNQVWELLVHNLNALSFFCHGWVINYNICVQCHCQCLDKKSTLGIPWSWGIPACRQMNLWVHMYCYASANISGREGGVFSPLHSH